MTTSEEGETSTYKITEKNQTYFLGFTLKKPYLIIRISFNEEESSNGFSDEYEQKFSLQSLVDANPAFRIYQSIEEVPEFLKSLLEDDKVTLSETKSSVNIILHTYMGNLKEPILVIPKKEPDMANYMSKGLELLKSKFAKDFSDLQTDFSKMKKENEKISGEVNDLKKQKSQLEKQVSEMKQDNSTLKSSIVSLGSKNVDMSKLVSREEFEKLQDEVDELLSWKNTFNKDFLKFKKEKDSLSSEVDKLKKDNAAMSKKISQLLDQQNSHLQEIQKLQEENSTQQNLIDELNSHKEIHTKEIANLRSRKKDNTSTEIPKIQEDMKELKEKIEMIEANTQEISKKADDTYKSNLKAIEETKNEFAHQTKESLSNIRTLIDNTNDQVNSVKEDVKDLRVKVDPESVQNSIVSSSRNEVNYTIDFDTIFKWISPRKKIQKKLLYKASRDGDKAVIFHSLCDNKGPTLSVIVTDNGAICGGYTTKNWDGSYSYRSDNEAFIFSLDKKRKYFPKDGNYAIYCSSNEGPSFGWGDLSLCDSFFSHENNHNQSYYYNFTTGELVGNKGNKNFWVREVEVYQISFE